MEPPRFKSVGLPAHSAEAPSTTAVALAELIEARRALVRARVDATLAAFDAALAGGAIQLEPDLANLEQVAIQWLPPEGWHHAHSATTKALAERTGMAVYWNGCAMCPVWLRPHTGPRPALLTPLDPDTVQGVIRAISSISKGAALSESDQAALGVIIAPILDFFRGGGGDGYGRYAGFLHAADEHREASACTHATRATIRLTTPRCVLQV